MTQMQDLTTASLLASFRQTAQKIPVQCAIVKWDPAPGDTAKAKRHFYPIGARNQFQLALAAAAPLQQNQNQYQQPGHVRRPAPPTPGYVDPYATAGGGAMVAAAARMAAAQGGGEILNYADGGEQQQQQQQQETFFWREPGSGAVTWTRPPPAAVAQLTPAEQRRWGAIDSDNSWSVPGGPGGVGGVGGVGDRGRGRGRGRGGKGGGGQQAQQQFAPPQQHQQQESYAGYVGNAGGGSVAIQRAKTNLQL
jgi:hypothetical protein